MNKYTAPLAAVLLLLAAISWTAAESDETAPAPESDAAGGSLMGGVIFPHDEHVEDLEVECDQCHHEANAARLTTPHEEYFDDFWIDCQICHRESQSAGVEPQACSDCHNPLLRGVADETRSAKVVIHQNCWTCHEVNSGAEASQSCKLCHTGPQSRSGGQRGGATVR